MVQPYKPKTIVTVENDKIELYKDLMLGNEPLAKSLKKNNKDSSKPFSNSSNEEGKRGTPNSSKKNGKSSIAPTPSQPLKVYPILYCSCDYFPS
jgi:hypothetical protein